MNPPPELSHDPVCRFRSDRAPASRIKTQRRLARFARLRLNPRSIRSARRIYRTSGAELGCSSRISDFDNRDYSRTEYRASARRVSIRTAPDCDPPDIVVAGRRRGRHWHASALSARIRKRADAAAARRRILRRRAARRPAQGAADRRRRACTRRGRHRRRVRLSQCSASASPSPPPVIRASGEPSKVAPPPAARRSHRPASSATIASATPARMSRSCARGKAGRLSRRCALGRAARRHFHGAGQRPRRLRRRRPSAERARRTAQGAHRSDPARPGGDAFDAAAATSRRRRRIHRPTPAVRSAAPPQAAPPAKRRRCMPPPAPARRRRQAVAPPPRANTLDTRAQLRRAAADARVVRHARQQQPAPLPLRPRRHRRRRRAAAGYLVQVIATQRGRRRERLPRHPVEIFERARQPAAPGPPRRPRQPRASITAPWSDRSAAARRRSQLCSSLKQAGGDCVVQQLTELRFALTLRRGAS